MTPNLTFTSCPNRKSKFTIKNNNISTTARGTFTICAPLYRSLIVKKYLQKGDPNLTFTSCPNRKSKFNIYKKSYINNRKRYIHNLCTIVQIVNCQKIFTKRWPPIWPLLPVQTGSQSLIFTSNRISTTARGKFTIFAPLYRSLIVNSDPNLTFTSWPNRKSKFTIKKDHISATARGKFTICTIVQIVNLSKNIYKKVTPNLTFTSCPNRKSKFTIKNNNISTTARGTFTICAPLYRSLIVKKYLQKGDPNLTFTSCPNRKSKFNIYKKSYLNNRKRYIHNLCTIVQIVNCQKIFTKRWPQFDLYFLSKPEVKV